MLTPAIFTYWGVANAPRAEVLSFPTMQVCPECGASFDEAGFCASDGTKLVSNVDDALIGLTVGPYRIASLLGVGGMGRVYKAVNPAIGSRVAIKVLNQECASSTELVERFFAEARAVNVIRHENIVNVLDLATLPDNRPYIVMEYLDGSALSAIIDANAKLPLGSFIRIVTEVLDALDAAHAKSIVHRDLKPDNIFVSPNGRAKVLDFGIAKLMPADSGRSGETRAGSLLGTPHYMAPEQAQSRPVDARADIYAAGVILFEGTSGRKPFSADSLFELLRMHIEAPPPSLRGLRSEIPLALEATILKALAKDPNHRQQSVRELAEELSHATNFLSADAWAPIGGGHASSLSIPTPNTATAPTAAADSAAGKPEALAPPPIRHSQNLPEPAEGPVHKASHRPLLITAALVLLIAVSAALALSSDSGESPVAIAPETALVPRPEAEQLASPEAEQLANPEAEPLASAAHQPTATAAPDAGLRVAAAPRLPRRPANHVSDAGSQTSKRRVQADANAESAAPIAKAPSSSNAAPDISHKSSSTPNPDAFDINGYLPIAYKKAQQVFADAELVRIDADGVLSSGKSDLSLDASFSVLYRFQSRANAKRPDDLALGIEHKPTCLYYVNVSAANVTAYGLEGWKCNMEYAGKPKCSTKKVWAQAIARGAPASNAIAELWYSSHQGKGRWSFSIKDTDFSWWIPDDC